MTDKFEYSKIKIFYSIFFLSEMSHKLGDVYNSSNLQTPGSRFGGGCGGETGTRKEQEFHRKGITNGHKHEKMVHFTSDQGHANGNQS